MIGKDKALEILKKAISLSKADQTEVVLMGGKSYVTAFANNYVHRNVGSEDYTLSVRAAFGKKVGAATADGISDEVIKKVVADAVLIAENQKENPDFVSFAKPKNHDISKSVSTGYAESTAKFSAMQRAEAVKKIVDKSKESGLNASGTFETEVDEIAIANSLGVEQYLLRTVASVKSVVMGGDSSGYSKESAADVNDISVDKVMEESIGIAEKGKNPKSIEPGKYEVILTPYALAEFISHLGYLALNARAMKEGSSFLIGNLGKKLLGDNITMYDDGLSKDTMPMPFDFEGVSKKKVVFFDKGVAKDVVYDTLTAYKDGKESTGHSLPQPSPYSPYPMNFIMDVGESTVDGMISNVKKGLFVQRFWYTNVMDPRKAIITGMTRDGLFLIENGKIVHPLQNMRFTESIITALNNVIELSKMKKIIYDMAPMTVPYARIKDFTFTGRTEF
jgi:PmbA protein